MIDTQAIRNKILDLAMRGQLTEQLPEDGTAEDLYQQIQAEKQTLVKAGKLKKEKPFSPITEDEAPYSIPDNWKWVRIGSILTLQSGKNITASDIKSEPDEDHNIPCYGGNGQRGYVSQPNVDGFHAIIGRQGALCGNINFAEGPFYATEHAVVVYEYAETDMKWAGLTLRFLNLNQYATSVAQPGLAVNKINKVLIPLPPIIEQQRIVDKIDQAFSVLDTIDALQTQYADNLTALKNKLIDAAIQGRLTEQLTEDGTAEELYKQIQTQKQTLIKAGKIKKEKQFSEITEDEKPFKIPRNWRWVSVGNVCINIQYGSSKKSSASGKMAVLRMGNIQAGKIVYDKLVYTSDDEEIAKYPLEKDDLLFNRTNSMELVGKAAIYKGEMPAIYAGYLIRITPLIMVSSYLNYVMQSKYYWEFCRTVRIDSNGQSNINAEKLKQFVFPLPPLMEQERIVTKLDAVFKAIEELNAYQ